MKSCSINILIGHPKTVPINRWQTTSTLNINDINIFIQTSRNNCILRRRYVCTLGLLSLSFFYNNIASLSERDGRFSSSKRQLATSAARFSLQFKYFPCVLYLPRILHKNINVVVRRTVRDVASGQRIDFLVNVSRVAKRSLYNLLCVAVYYRASIKLYVCIKRLAPQS